MKHIKVVTAILLLLFSNKSTASPQSPDLLIYNGDTTAVYTLLLELYFDRIKKNVDNDGQLFGLKFREGATLNCWRGYQAIYKIENDSLFLVHITRCDEYYLAGSIDSNESKRRIEEIFGAKVKDGKVLINWYSGSLGIPKNEKKILRWDGVFYTIYEEEIQIKINKGRVLKISEIENYIDKPDRINRRYQDTVSNVIFAEIQKIKWGYNDKLDCSERYWITIGKSGNITSVKMVEYQTKSEIKEYWTRREYNYCIRKLKKGLKDLRFDVIRKMGRPIAEDIYIEIWFEDDGTIENWTN